MVDVSDPSYNKNKEKAPDLDEIEETLKDIRQEQKNDLC